MPSAREFRGRRCARRLLASICAALLSCICTRVVVAQVKSHLVPRDFDPQNSYQEYTYDDLHDYIADTIGTTNSFDETKVKILAGVYAGPTSTEVFSNPKGLFGGDDCRVETCNWMVFLSVPRVSKARLWYGTQIFLYFADHKQFDRFAKAKDQNCYSQGCFVLVKGVLGHLHLNRPKRWLIPNDYAYIRVDDVRLYPWVESYWLDWAKGAGGAVVKLRDFMKALPSPDGQ